MDGIAGVMYSVFFFFQAEDGIRDVAVTGVQTCALPIWSLRRPGSALTRPARRCSMSTPRRTWTAFERRGRAAMSPDPYPPPPAARYALPRSEERRVGKECRSRWSAYHEKKQQQRKAVDA